MYIQWFFFLSTHFCALHRLRVNSMSVQFSCSFSAHQHLLHTAPSPHGSPGSPNIRGISPGRHHSHGRSQRLNNFSLIFPVASRHPRISYFHQNDSPKKSLFHPISKFILSQETMVLKPPSPQVFNRTGIRPVDIHHWSTVHIV